jgi:hypothetical protein
MSGMMSGIFRILTDKRNDERNFPHPGIKSRRRAVSKVFVETSTHLIEGIDEMVKEGYYANRTEAVNEAINQMLKQYKISKLHAKDARYAQQAGGSG